MDCSNFEELLRQLIEEHVEEHNATIGGLGDHGGDKIRAVVETYAESEILTRDAGLVVEWTETREGKTRVKAVFHVTIVEAAGGFDPIDSDDDGDDDDEFEEEYNDKCEGADFSRLIPGLPRSRLMAMDLRPLPFKYASAFGSFVEWLSSNQQWLEGELKKDAEVWRAVMSGYSWARKEENSASFPTMLILPGSMFSYLYAILCRMMEDLENRTFDAVERIDRETCDKLSEMMLEVNEKSVTCSVEECDNLAVEWKDGDCVCGAHA